MHTHAKPHTSREASCGAAAASSWRCCRPCRPGDAEPRTASWSRRRWLWHWYIQGRQWTPLQRAESCAALCRTFPASAGRPARCETRSMAASGAVRSGTAFKDLPPKDFETRQTQASAAQWPVLSSISFLGAQHWTRAAVRQGFIAERELMKPIKRLHDPSLSRGRTVVALRKLSARRLARRQTAHLSNHQNHHSKVTRACANVYTRMHFFFRVRGCAKPKFGLKTRLRTHTRIVRLGRGRDSSAGPYRVSLR